MKKAFICTLYAHRDDENRRLYVCDGAPFPAKFDPSEWRMVVLGIEAPTQAEVGLRANRWHQLFVEEPALHQA